VAGVEVVVEDADVGSGGAGAGLDGEVVVPGVDEGVGDGDVGGVGGDLGPGLAEVEAVAVERVAGDVDDDAPAGA
jgi:hypothetical protein